MKLYKIRRKSDGLYADGGDGPPIFGKTGKAWRRLGDLKSHMTQTHKRVVRDIIWDDRSGRPRMTAHPYAGCELVVFEVSEVEAGSDFFAEEVRRFRKLCEDPFYLRHNGTPEAVSVLAGLSLEATP